MSSSISPSTLLNLPQIQIKSTSSRWNLSILDQVEQSDVLAMRESIEFMAQEGKGIRGLLYPILVGYLDTGEGYKRPYIVDGLVRVLAWQQAYPSERIPHLLVSISSIEEAYLVRMEANLRRRDLSILDRSIMVAQRAELLRSMGQLQLPGNPVEGAITVEDIASEMGIARSTYHMYERIGRTLGDVYQEIKSAELQNEARTLRTISAAETKAEKLKLIKQATTASTKAKTPAKAKPKSAENILPLKAFRQKFEPHTWWKTGSSGKLFVGDPKHPDFSHMMATTEADVAVLSDPTIPAETANRIYLVEPKQLRDAVHHIGAECRVTTQIVMKDDPSRILTVFFVGEMFEDLDIKPFSEVAERKSAIRAIFRLIPNTTRAIVTHLEPGMLEEGFKSSLTLFSAVQGDVQTLLAEWRQEVGMSAFVRALELEVEQEREAS